MFQYNGKSFFSGVNEVVKIFSFLVFVALAFFFQNPLHLLGLLFVLIVLLIIANYRGFVSLFFGLVPFLLLADIGFFVFLSDTSVDLVRLTIVSNFRVLSIFSATALFTFSTDIFSLVKLMRKVRLPEFVYLPVYILFRFLPELEHDLIEIKGIQKTRGVTKKKPVLFVRSLLIPLLFTVLQKSDELAVAYYLRKKRESS